MRHFYTDANYCCVSQSFINEEALHLPAKCSIPPWRRSAERDVSLREWRGRQARRRHNKRAACFSRRVQFRNVADTSRAALHISISCPWPPGPPRSIEQNPKCSKGHQRHAWGFNGISCKGTKINLHLSDSFAFHLLSSAAISQPRTLQGALHFNSHLWTVI